MALFDEILRALENPRQEASADQLSNILASLNGAAAQTDVRSDQLQPLLSVMGDYVRNALCDHRSQGGDESIAQLLERHGHAHAQPDPNAVESLFRHNPEHLDQLKSESASCTGLDPATISQLLPIVLPLVLSLLRSGRTTEAASAPGSSVKNNNVLSAFLDSDGDGDVDLSDTLRLASRVLGQPQPNANSAPR